MRLAQVHRERLADTKAGEGEIMRKKKARIFDLPVSLTHEAGSQETIVTYRRPVMERFFSLPWRPLEKTATVRIDGTAFPSVESDGRHALIVALDEAENG
jgi:hypothetical protein